MRPVGGRYRRKYKDESTSKQKGGACGGGGGGIYLPPPTAFACTKRATDRLRFNCFVSTKIKVIGRFVSTKRGHRALRFSNKKVIASFGHAWVVVHGWLIWTSKMIESLSEIVHLGHVESIENR